ncbi:hypothetical protein EVAR_81442_1 [Eumeta japonica]|uniref:Uncharacterized protein n=1 Tax=Eumeta variegata TaxID=151549 RepID=A0A4C1VZ67_EUMVA|nr:hypothetical protein EVAR_81442_1 [Eumeta japonica]
MTMQRGYVVSVYRIQFGRGSCPVAPCSYRAWADSTSSTATQKLRRCRKLATTLVRAGGNEVSMSLYMRPSCHTLSKAFSISKSTATVYLSQFLSEAR